MTVDHIAWWTRLHWLAEKRCAGDTHDVTWTVFSDTALVGQCTRCRRVLGVVTRRGGAGVDACVSTSSRPSSDVDGATE